MIDQDSAILEVDCANTVQDYVAFNLHQSRPRRLEIWAVLGVMVLLVLAFFWGLWFLTGRPDAALPGLIPYSVGPFVIWVFLLPFGWFMIHVNARILFRRNPEMLTGQRMALTPEGVGNDGQFGYGLRRWRGIRKVARTRDHVFLYTTTMSAFLVARRDFGSDEEFNEFVRTARRRWERAKAGHDVAPAPPPWLQNTDWPLRTAKGPDEGVFRP
jgi:hypothetical protein